MPESQTKNNQTLKGQVALVTGASSGLGWSIAESMGNAGADVAVNYRSGKESADELVDLIRATGRRAMAVQADVSKESDVQNMFSQVIEEFGTIDILVNNAGMQQDATIDEMTLDQWNRVIGVNLTGQFLCAREAIREFKRRGVRAEVSHAAGKIICISSIHEVIPWAGHVNYAASKGGVMLLMKSIAQEVAPFKIRVNSISPGAIKTPINRDAWESEQAMNNLLKLIPYGRIGEPEDIGMTAVWLASDQADYLNGISILVDGGMSLYPAFASGG